MIVLLFDTMSKPVGIVAGLYIYRVQFTKKLPVIFYKPCATAEGTCQEQQPQ